MLIKTVIKNKFNIEILGEGFADLMWVHLLIFLCIHRGLLEYFHQCTKKRKLKRKIDS